MKKIALITLNDNHNFGNRLQNYATQYILEKFNFEVETIWYDYKFKDKLKEKIKKIVPIDKFRREKLFMKFSERIHTKYINKIHKFKNNYDYYVTGSDQVWNFTFSPLERTLLNFVNSENKISFSSSFGTSYLPENYKAMFKKSLSNYKYISVREDAGKHIIEDLKINKNVEVLVDPTMLLNEEQWLKVVKKPSCYKEKKYILNYFLGNLSNEKKHMIEEFAKENDYEIINLLNKKEPYYISGPSEFLWLEKNAELICTDSFHSSVFALIFNKPFIIFDREEAGIEKMNSRIDTFLKKFALEDRLYDGRGISNKSLKHNYENAYRILEEERKKSENFLKKALDLDIKGKY